MVRFLIYSLPKCSVFGKYGGANLKWIWFIGHSHWAIISTRSVIKMSLRYVVCGTTIVIARSHAQKTHIERVSQQASERHRHMASSWPKYATISTLHKMLGPNIFSRRKSHVCKQHKMWNWIVADFSYISQIRNEFKTWKEREQSTFKHLKGNLRRWIKLPFEFVFRFVWHLFVKRFVFVRARIRLVQRTEPIGRSLVRASERYRGRASKIANCKPQSPQNENKWWKII